MLSHCDMKISPENDRSARAGTETLARDIVMNGCSGPQLLHAEYPAGDLFAPRGGYCVISDLSSSGMIRLIRIRF